MPRISWFRLAVGPVQLVRVAALAVSVWLALSAAAAGPQRSLHGPALRGARPAAAPRFIDHRYRVLGRVRLLLFWSGASEVGAARMTWRGEGAERSIALLIGSDPRRAPRGLNEWGYVREEVRATGSDSFELRSLTSPGFSPEPKIRFGGPGQMFGAVCSSATPVHVRSWTTAVQADEISYRTFGRVLDRVAVAPSWETQHVARPAGAEAGFLTALERLLRSSCASSADSDGAGETLAPITYTYKGVLYDLQLRRLRRVGERAIRGVTFDHLVRADFTIRNRTLGATTKFSVTYPSEGPHASLPVEISFQPNWWLSVELQLDEEADAPPDPGQDAATLARIRSLCAAAGNR